MIRTVDTEAVCLSVAGTQSVACARALALTYPAPLQHISTLYITCMQNLCGESGRRKMFYKLLTAQRKVCNSELNNLHDSTAHI